MSHLFCSFFAVGSRDMSCRIFSLHSIPGFHYVTLAAHRTALVACFFQYHSLNVRLPPTLYHSPSNSIHYTPIFVAELSHTLFHYPCSAKACATCMSLLTLHAVGPPLHTKLVHLCIPLYTIIVLYVSVFRCTQWPRMVPWWCGSVA